MRSAASILLGSLTLLTPAWAQTKSPFLGRWDFNLTRTNNDVGANWMAVSEKDGMPEVLFQPTGGHVAPVEDFKINGSHLTMVTSPASAKNPATVWELDVAGSRITGVQKRGDQSTTLIGVRAPDLKRAAPGAWTTPEPLFNGRNLDGWEAIGDAAGNHWVVRDGLLINEEHGANIRTARRFHDFRLHYEVWCPERANSGFYLRGRYEVQISSGPGSAPSPAGTARPAGGRAGSVPPNRSMGSVYGRLAPEAPVSSGADGWDTFDITLVGRNVTIVRNGVTTIDHKDIEGITGGALDADEGEPGPFYIQGDHTGNMKFRNITISVPKS